MIPRAGIRRPPDRYPVDPWRIVERGFDAELLEQNETIFSVSNGWMGIRGAFEEGAPALHNGIFVNGFYESYPIAYPEEAFGFARTGQEILTVPDAKVIRLFVDDEPFVLGRAHLVHYERALDMRRGTLDREVLWELPSGDRVEISSRRLVSIRHRHLAAIRYEVRLLDRPARLTLYSEIRNRSHDRRSNGDPRRSGGLQEHMLLPRRSEHRDTRLLLAHATMRSGLAVACGVDHRLETDAPHAERVRTEPNEAAVAISAQAQPETPVRLDKVFTYHVGPEGSIDDLCRRAHRTLDLGGSHGFDTLAAEQETSVRRFWEVGDVELRGAPELQQALRFNLFQILQASARAEGVGVPAKGLTGTGYQGHYFWDTEIYVLPFLCYTQPRVARNLLEHRFGFLEKARERARHVNQAGALFPWRTINGEEASAHYAASTAQYHIDADIAYALRKYTSVTGDETLLRSPGAEVLVETARLWADLGFYSERAGGRFCIHGVTGPDEYTTVVNNNAYTNLMARENLSWAAEVLERMRAEDADAYGDIVERTGLDEAEVDDWRRAANWMFVPYDEELGIHPQDDTFLERERWDFAGTPRDRYPLLLHYHPLVIYRHQVIKQADVVLAMFLLGHRFSAEQKKRNFDYYDPLTTGDSSLSVPIQSVVAAEVGYREKAWEYARYSATMDLADVGGNVRDGLHIASMGGTWMAFVYGLAGLRDSNGEIAFRPRPPERFDGLAFSLRVRGRRLRVVIESETVRYRLEDGDELRLRHEQEPIVLTVDAPEAERPLETGPTGPVVGG